MVNEVQKLTEELEFEYQNYGCPLNVTMEAMRMAIRDYADKQGIGCMEVKCKHQQ